MPTLSWNLDAQPLGISIQGADVPAQQNDQFGTDVLFVEQAEVTDAGDLRLVSGSENLRRAVLRRLIVAPGEHRLNPAYGVGVGRYVKKRQTKANLDALRHAIVDNLSRERRIAKVRSVDVQATFFGEQPGIVVTVSVLALGRQLTFQPFNFTEKGTF